MPLHTKIICTIGPAVNTLEKIIELIQAGMNVARLNMSHGTHEEHAHNINLLKKARTKLGIPLAIMLDTKGPEVSIGVLQGGEIELETGNKWKLVKKEIVGDKNQVSIIPGDILQRLSVGDCVLFNDGYISSHVISITPEGVIVEIENSGSLVSGKGVNVPSVSLGLPAVTEEDVEDIKFGCKHNVEIIAASFVRSAENVITIRKLLEQEKSEDTLIIAKIENQEGVQNFDSIVQLVDGVMIARGDLGVEVPLSQVPKLQKDMIRKCLMSGKISVTATQMLESMIRNPRPTRAEVSDVANAIYDSTSAVMLSGETAIGRYPIETVNVMRSIVEEAESDFDYRGFFNLHSTIVYHDVPSSLTLAAVKMAYSSGATAIFALTFRGGTARLVSRLRPVMPIVAMTPNEKCYNQLAINWGVTPYYQNGSKNFAEAFPKISAFALENKLVSLGDLVVVTAGTPFGISGTTNMMILENLGDVLVRGHIGFGSRTFGKVAIVHTPEKIKPYEIRGKLIVIAKCDESYKGLMQEASGIILQNRIDDHESENFGLQIAKEYNKPIIVRADAALTVLKEGLIVTIDPEKALVYKGASIEL